MKIRCSAFWMILMFSLLAQNAWGGELMVHEAWVMRPPPNSSAAVFMNIHNHTGKEVVLVGAVTEAAERVEIHESVMTDEMAQMKRREKVSIPAGETLVLAPRGLHLMLVEPVDLSEDDSVQIDLKFESAESITVQAPVRRGPPEHEHGPDHQSHH